MATQISIYTQTEYYADLIQQVDQVGDGGRIALASMSFNHLDPSVATLLPKLACAARRGVNVLLVVDTATFIFDSTYKPTGPAAPFPIGGNRKTKAVFGERIAALNELRQAGVSVTQTNEPKQIHIPFADRSHIKAAVINDMWRVGGCNLDDTSNLDVMAGANNDPKTATYIYNILQQIAAAGSVRAALGDSDLVHPIDDSTELLIDVGRPGQSVIYERALDTIRNAKDWVTMTCQFFPSGKTAALLAGATKRGVTVKALYNGPTDKRLGGGVMDIYRRYERLIRPAALFEGEIDPSLPFLHAKIVASESEANIGSHNNISAGVILGTAEIALHSTNPALARAAGDMALQLSGSRRDTILTDV